MTTEPRLLPWIALGLVLLLAAAPAPARAADEWQVELKDVSIPMRDGKGLAADVYLPPQAGSYPAVVIQTPYNRKRLGAPIGGQAEKVTETGRGAISDTLGLLDREHYAYVVVDWRGFYGSKAAMEGVEKRSARRGRDGYDVIEWVGTQPWCNGKVGTWGGSALGRIQLDTALEHPPHLVCCVPLIAPLGQAYDGYYEGEILLEAHVRTLDLLGFGVSALVRRAPDPGAAVWRAAERLTYRPEAIDVPCLMITGWWDNFPDQILRSFEDIVAKGGEAARRHSRLLIGPWDHVSIGVAEQGDLRFDGAAKASAAAAKAFFDSWLRGVDNGWAQTPRVRYWMVNEDHWFEAESWSGIRRRTTTLFLGADGRIVAAQPEGDAVRQYRYDPKDATPTLGGANLPPLPHGPKDQSKLGERKDVLAYTTGPLAEALRVNGVVELVLPFTANRATCDFTARLCDGSGGKAWLLADAARRVKGVKPGETGRVTLRFPATAATLPAGHDLRLYVSSSNWPRYERNPHTGADHWDEKGALDLEVTLHQDGAELRVPVPE